MNDRSCRAVTRLRVTFVFALAALAGAAYAAPATQVNPAAVHPAAPAPPVQLHVVDNAAPQVLPTRIRAVRVVSEAPGEVVFDVDYQYGGEQGERVFAGAYGLSAGRRVALGYVPGAVSPGVGTARVALRRLGNTAGNVVSDTVLIDLYVGGGGAFISARYALAKTWLGGNAALPEVAAYGVEVAPVPATASTEAAAADQVVGRRITPEGKVELAYADGRREQFFRGGHTVIFPDGRQQQMLMSSSQPPTPPVPPPGSSLDAWLSGEAERLLDVLRLLVGNDESQITAYLGREPANATTFTRISLRREAIAYMVQP